MLKWPGTKKSNTKEMSSSSSSFLVTPPPSPRLSSLPEDTEVAKLHRDADPDAGGLSCTNDDLLKAQQRAITKWMKGMGQKLLSGNLNLINTPFPVDIFEPRSYLEKLADVWVYPRYLNQAAVTTSPLERMKLVITWFIAGLHHSFEKWKKPFNPILGETWQASLSDGSSIFVEQISHHPPVSAFHIEGSGGAYRFVGLSEPTVSLLLMAGGFKTVAKGYRYVEFTDGTHIDIAYPAYCMKGIANGTLGIAKGRPRALVEGVAVFTDAKNCLRGSVRFGPNKLATGVNKHILKRLDAVHGEIYDMRDVTAAFSKLGVKVPAEPEPSIAKQDPGGRSPTADDFESASETDWDMRDESPTADGAAEASRQQQQRQQQREEAATTSAAVAAATSLPALAEAARSALLPQPLPLPLRPRSDSNLSGPDQLVGSAPAGDGAEDLDDDEGHGVGARGGGGDNSASLGGKKKGSWFGKVLGYGSQSSSPRSGASESQQGLGRVVSRLQGSWLSHVDFDGVRFWAWEHERPDAWQSVPHPLPSDSRFREDLAMLARGGDIKLAQEAKERLEKMQRNDKKLREAH